MPLPPGFRTIIVLGRCIAYRQCSSCGAASAASFLKPEELIVYDKTMYWLNVLGNFIIGGTGVFYGIVTVVATAQEPHAQAPMPWPVIVLLMAFIFAAVCFVTCFMMGAMVKACGAAKGAVDICRKTFSRMTDAVSVAIVTAVFVVAAICAWIGADWMIANEVAKFGRATTEDYLVVPIYGATLFFMAVLLQSFVVAAVGVVRDCFNAESRLVKPEQG